jgi:micrococcal nuclease
MIEQGYAWAYDGGAKEKDFEVLKEIRVKHGSWVV